jgi:hypothetical protein
VTLGNPRLHEARRNAVGAVKAEADRYAANVLPIIREAQKAGALMRNVPPEIQIIFGWTGASERTLSSHSCNVAFAMGQATLTGFKVRFEEHYANELDRVVKG